MPDRVIQGAERSEGKDVVPARRGAELGLPTRGHSEGPDLTRPRVLYVTYWGAAEPLGQSLVLPAVTRLAGLGVELTLVTFEKPKDLERAAEMTRIEGLLQGHGVHWMALRYHKRPKWPATLWDVAQGVARGVAQSLVKRPHIVHARTFVGGAVGLILAPLLRAKLIYHNEGFYPDEQVDGGIWTEGSLSHRVTRALERRLYSHAHGIIVLSERARAVIEGIPAVRQRHTPLVVVPSCVDLDRFPPVRIEKQRRSGVLCLAYVGSVGGRYRFDRVGDLVATALRRVGRVHLRVLTPTEPAKIEALLQGSRLPREAWSVASVPYAQMPAELAAQDAGLFLFTQGMSELGCSPTKIGEYWAAGLPVVTTANVSDTEEIIRRERVGVILHDHSDEAYDAAIAELLNLLADPELPVRCRRAAEGHYALQPACERQFELYKRLSPCPAAS